MDKYIIEFINKITTQGQEAIHLENMDLLWNMPNECIKSKLILNQLLAKLMLLPIISNIDELCNEYSLNNNYKNILNEINNQLIMFSNMSQKYIIQEFTIQSIAHSLFDDLISNLPVEKNITSTEQLMEFVNNYIQLKLPSSQSGGFKGNLSNQFFIGLLLIFVLCSISSPELIIDENKLGKQVFPLITSNNEIMPYNKDILNITDKDIIISIDNLEYQQTNNIDLNKVVQVYNSDLEKNKTSILAPIYNIFKKYLTAQDMLVQVINDFNSRSISFSRQCESNCMRMVKEAYDKQVFINFKSLDNIETTVEKINSIKQIEAQRIEDQKKTIWESATTVFASGVQAVFQPETIAQPIFLGADLAISGIQSVMNILSFNEKEVIKQIMSEQSVTNMYQLSAEERRKLNERIYTFSKLYCVNSFNLQLNLNIQNNTLSAVGDKIDYNWMINLIQIIEANISSKMEEIKVSQDDAKSKEVALHILQSIKERFDILRTIIQELDSIINYSLKASLNKQIQYPTVRSIENIDNYFKEQLDYLTNLLNSLEKMFPLQEKQKEQAQIVLQDNLRLQQIENNITLGEQTALNLQRQFEANITLTNWNSEIMAFQTIMKGYKEFVSGKFQEYSGLTETFSQSITKLATSPVIGAFKGLTDQFSELIFYLLWSKSGMTILALLLVCLFFYCSFTFGTMTIINWMGKPFVFIFWNGFTFIYGIVKTTAGYIIYPVTVFYSKPTNTQTNLNDQNQNVPRILSDDESTAISGLLELKSRNGGTKKNKRVKKLSKSTNKKNKGKKTRKGHKKRRTRK
jgi:hypothetical protein